MGRCDGSLLAADSFSMKTSQIMAGLGAVVTMTGCASYQDESSSARAGAPAVPLKAVAELAAASNSEAKGTVTFTQEGAMTRVEATVSGLSPGLHGFHIHEKGDCSAPDASSAGG